MNGTVQEQIQWLIRKKGPLPVGLERESAPTSVIVLGPFHTDQVRAMVEQGMLDADDELCPENGYWFGMHETLEVKRFLGIDNVVLPRALGAEDTTETDLETTAPDLQIHDEKTPPSLNADQVQSSSLTPPDATGIITIKRPQPAAPAPGAAASSAAPQAGAPGAGGAAKTSRTPPPQRAATPQELASRFQRVTPQKPLAYENPEELAGRGQTTLGMEKGQLLGVLIIAGVILAIIGVIWVIRSFRV